MNKKIIAIGYCYQKYFFIHLLKNLGRAEIVRILSSMKEIIGNYKNGKREGEWKVYRENGKLEQIENYKNGKEEGEWKVYLKMES